MPSSVRLLKRLVVGLLGLLVTLSALAVPLADALHQLPPAIGDRAPEPAPLVVVAVALLALGAALRHRAGGAGRSR